MNFEDCVKFANENPASYVATVDKGRQLRVRGFQIGLLKERGFTSTREQ